MPGQVVVRREEPMVVGRREVAIVYQVEPGRSEHANIVDVHYGSARAVAERKLDRTGVEPRSASEYF